MPDIYDRIRVYGWRTVELASMIVIFCVLLNIILGDGGGAFVTSVANNAILFAQDVPAGTLLGLVLVALVYRFYLKREKPG